MVLEHDDLRGRLGRPSEFESVLRRGVKRMIARVEGFLAFRVAPGIQSRARCLSPGTRDSLDSRTVDGRQSPAFARWREIVGPFFAAPPQVEHFERLAAPARG